MVMNLTVGIILSHVYTNAQLRRQTSERSHRKGLLGTKGLRQQRSSVFVCHGGGGGGGGGAASEGRYCCSAEHAGLPHRIVVPGILKQAPVIIRPQTNGLTRLCHSIHFRRVCALGGRPGCTAAAAGPLPPIRVQVCARVSQRLWLLLITCLRRADHETYTSSESAIST